MSEPAIAGPSAPVERERAIGFHGKIPARGDFVSAGLPRAFIDPWHGWMERMLAGSRIALGETWLPAWLEAPVWHFALAPGLCGPDAVLGVWLPSVDHVGRHFPLTIARIAAVADPVELVRDDGGFLASAERAGREAIEQDLAPGELARRLAATDTAPAADPSIAPPTCPSRGGLWWTEGAPRVPAAAFSIEGMPDAARFARMLDAGAAVSQAMPVSSVQ
jgi:type VI secretion system protein ImpM